MTEFFTLLEALAKERVEFLLIGGVAARLHGAERFTSDLDILYRRDESNYPRLVRALQRFDPYPRGAPPGLPFLFDAKTIAAGGNFTLITSEGAIDLLATIAGGDYDSLVNESTMVKMPRCTCAVINIETLIRVKRAAGRPKDFEAIAELEQIAEQRGDG